jgi:DNA-binding NarL/FixJ family response regulator
MTNMISSLGYASQNTDQNQEPECIAQLIMHARQVIQLIGQGMENEQIAAQLQLSETTINHHLTSIYKKVLVSDRLELLVFAHRQSLT